MKEVNLFDSELLFNQLNEMYFNLLMIPEFEDLNKAAQAVVDKLNEMNINGIARYLLTKENPDDEDAKLCYIIIELTQFIYNETSIESPISDSLYDSLYELNRSISNLEVVGSVFNSMGKVIANHSYTSLRGTLDKIHFIYDKDKGNEKNKKSIEYWLAGVRRRLVDEVGTAKANSLMESLELLSMPKYDGVSLILELDSDHIVENALTRGDTDKNEAVELSNIFENLDMSGLIIDNGDGKLCGVKCECIMTFSQYELYCKEYGDYNNPRAATVSALNNLSHGPEILQYLTICPLRVQIKGEERSTVYTELNKDCIFTDEVNINTTDLSFFKNRIESIKDKMNDRGIPIDGVVFVITDPEIQKILGRRNDKINNFEFAYKFEAERYKTKVIDITWQYGKMGGITPVALFEKLVINGNDVSHVTLSSIRKINELKLAPMDEILITYNIVPYIMMDSTCKRSGLPEFKIPKHCPKCKEKLTLSESGAMLKCDNPSCPSRGIGRLVNYIETMRIPNINMGTVSKFFMNNILWRIEDLYSLSNYKNVIVNMNGFGEKSYNNIIKGINSRRNVYDYELLGSLGIRDVKTQTFKSILSIYNLSGLLDICSKYDTDSLTEISGIGEKTATKIVEGVNQNHKTIEFLLKELKVKESKGEKKKDYDLTVCFTGFRDAKFKEFLEDNNIEVKDSYSKKVQVVVYDEIVDSEGNRRKPEPSTKMIKAIEDGKKVISKRELYESIKRS